MNFNFIRPLTAEEYEGLKADIKANGQLVPILRDQYNVTLDGHHREKALTELGVPHDQWKILLRTFANDDERIAAVLSANHHRRQSTPEDRKQLVGYLHKQGWAQERIAKQLRVSQMTVSRDLTELNIMFNSQNVTQGNNSQAKTTANPKGAGRPKKKATTPSAKQTATTAALAAAVIATTGKRPGHKYDAVTEKAVASAILDGGKSTQEVKDELGVSEQVIIRSTEYEKGYRAARADPEIRLEDITSIPQRKRAEAAIRQKVAAYVKELDDHYGKRLHAEIQQHIKDILLPSYWDKIRRANEIERSRLKGVFKPEEYRLILSCLHSDGQRTAERLDKAFKMFKSREASLLSEKDDPSPQLTDFPKTAEDWNKLREAKRAEDRAKREANKKAKAAGTAGANSPVDVR